MVCALMFPVCTDSEAADTNQSFVRTSAENLVDLSLNAEVSILLLLDKQQINIKHEVHPKKSIHQHV